MEGMISLSNNLKFIVVCYGYYNTIYKVFLFQCEHQKKNGWKVEKVFVCYRNIVENLFPFILL